MYKKINLLKCMSAILFFFILGLASFSVAGNCGDCDEPPTVPGNACKCDGTKPTINATFAEGMDTIDSINPVTLSASGGCPPYTWSLSGSGYSLVNNENGTMKLSVISGICGDNYDIYCSVTVTDTCGNSVSATIRNTSGRWISKGSGSSNVFTISCNYNRYYLHAIPQLIIGNQRWTFGLISYHWETGSCDPTWTNILSGSPVSPPISPKEAHDRSSCTFNGSGHDVGFAYNYYYYEWGC
jgi:hypothetical protein